MVDQTRHLRKVHRKGFDDAGVITWKDNLIPMLRDTRQFGCDCSVAWGEPSQIWVLVPSDAPRTSMGRCFHRSEASS
jgi:hypothetical protein